MPVRIPMTERQRAALLALTDTEAMVVRYHGLNAEEKWFGESEQRG